MFGSWLLGFFGTLVGIGGSLLTLLGFFLGSARHDWSMLIVGIALIALASFCKYLSKQTVRVKQ
jgi:hypothetical protein